MKKDEREMNTPMGQIVTVYRNPYLFWAVLSGFIFFLVFVLLDKFSIIDFGWFGQIPVIGYVFLGFLIVMTTWLLWVSSFLNTPAVKIDDETISLTSATIPTRSTTIKISQITVVSSTSYPGIIPDYLILEMDHVEDNQRKSGVWMRIEEPRYHYAGGWAKIEGTRYYYDCSNLTHNARQLRSIIEGRIEKRD